MIQPRYPVYIPSKGRFETCHTAKCLDEYGTPFRIVVEKPEEKEYVARFGRKRVIRLPFQNRGLISTRNWIKEHATRSGAKRHWQLDDNITEFFRAYKLKRLNITPSIALRATEDFVDRYTNVAIAGLNYDFFYRPTDNAIPPFYLNQHVYSCSLILNSLPHRWRSALNDDTDICLQVLADGWCTVLMNAFLCGKCQTMAVKGGNTQIYQGDGRLRMARALERLWPGVAETKRIFKRPQHRIKHQWQHFDTPLIRKPNVKIPTTPNEYGLTLVAVRPIQSKSLRRFAKEHAVCQK